MRMRTRISVLWMTATFLLVGSAFSFASTSAKHATHHATVSQTADANEQDESAEAPENETKDESQDPGSQDQSKARKLNHGFYVSQAAQCKNVDDPSTPANPDFTAPADCTGKAHGQYVSSVAHSSLGKSNKGHKGGKP
jgi:hypothetical protein